MYQTSVIILIADQLSYENIQFQLICISLFKVLIIIIAAHVAWEAAIPHSINKYKNIIHKTIFKFLRLYAAAFHTKCATSLIIIFNYVALRSISFAYQSNILSSN